MGDDFDACMHACIDTIFSVSNLRWMDGMNENSIQIYATPQGPQVYFGPLRIHHWPLGLMSAIIGVLGLIFDDNDDHRKYYTTLFLGGVVIFIDDLPDFITFLRGLQE